MVDIKSILILLVRISTMIRQSAIKSRYQKADESLNEENFEDFKRHLTVLIALGSMAANAQEHNDNTGMQHRLMDSTSLTKAQKRLVHVNIPRRNRIIYDTRSMTLIEAPTIPQTVGAALD